MSNFEKFAVIVNNNFNTLSSKPLFRSNTDSEEIKRVYLEAFPPGTNELYLTNTQHDCTCCKSFIRNVGNLVSITNGDLTTIWDNCEDAPYPYNVVAKQMEAYVKSKPISSVFLASEKKYGAYMSKQTLDDGSIINWNHFHCIIPEQLFGGDRVGERAGQYAIKMLEAKRIRDYNAMTAKGITPELLQLRRLELRELELTKWNGVLPTTLMSTGDSGVPVILNTK